MSVWNRQPVPSNTNYYAALKVSQSLTPLRQIGAEHWLETEWGKPSPELFEQVLLQANGFAMIMLWAEIAENEFDPDENKTSKERYRDRMSRYQ